MENIPKYRMVAYLNDEKVPKNLVIPVFEEIKEYKEKDKYTLYLGLGEGEYNSFKTLKSNETITYIGNIMFQMLMASTIVSEGDKPIFGHLSNDQLFVAPVVDMKEFLTDTDDDKELEEKIVKYKEYSKILERVYKEDR